MEKGIESNHIFFCLLPRQSEHFLSKHASQVEKLNEIESDNEVVGWGEIPCVALGVCGGNLKIIRDCSIGVVHRKHP